jgi:septal ring factor EnvC (AmiA/AmiB activator)
MIDPRWKEPSAIVLARDLWIEIEKKDADLARLRMEIENTKSVADNERRSANILARDNTRLREENAKLLEEVNLKNQWEHDRINELARLSALVEEAREKLDNSPCDGCGIMVWADWLRRAGEGK